MIDEAEKAMIRSAQDSPSSIAPVEKALPSADGGGPANVAQLVRQQLMGSAYCFVRTVDCEFEGGTITLRGRVPSFYLKQIAQTLAQKVEGVTAIVNLVDVTSGSDLALPRQ